MKVRTTAVMMCVGDNLNIPSFKVAVEGGIPPMEAYGASLIEAVGMLVLQHQTEFNIQAVIDTDREEERLYLAPVIGEPVL